MAITTTIQEILEGLKDKRFFNEQAISQGILLRLLTELGWNTWDTTCVWPEYQTGNGRADYALCHPPGMPLILVEVKQIGKAEEGVEQALAYAFRTGVPFVLLTDGQTWSFYLPAEAGTYEDRRVHKLDLYERPANEAAEILKRYLAHDRVVSGQALEEARAEYRNRTRRSQARNTIPTVWRTLVERGDERLVEALCDAVESKIGVRPEKDDVVAYLASLAPKTPPVPLLNANISANGSRPAANQEKLVRVAQGKTLIFRGQAKAYSSGRHALCIILVELAREDDSFLARLSEHPTMRGTKRRYIARTIEEIYPNQKHLWHMHAKLPGGWLLCTNLSSAMKKKIIQAACQVANLEFGKDVVVPF